MIALPYSTDNGMPQPLSVRARRYSRSAIIGDSENVLKLEAISLTLTVYGLGIGQQLVVKVKHVRSAV